MSIFNIDTKFYVFKSCVYNAVSECLAAVKKTKQTANIEMKKLFARYFNNTIMDRYFSCI